eukprot:7807564-Ditylum_brightwellii.AAC.1
MEDNIRPVMLKGLVSDDLEACPSHPLCQQVQVDLWYFMLLDKKLAVKLLFTKLGMMIIICLLCGVEKLSLAKCVKVAGDGCGGSENHAGERVVRLLSVLYQ